VGQFFLFAAVRNPASGAVPIKAAKGKSRQIKANRLENMNKSPMIGEVYSAKSLLPAKLFGVWLFNSSESVIDVTA
jgi:hypothetical protein